ncbi:MAG: hypothetical protein V3V18_04625 [Methylococcales bacterium]
MSGLLIPLCISFVVAYWFYITAKRAELKENWPVLWAFLGGLGFYASAKLSMFLASQIFIITVITGNEPDMPRFLIIGLGCAIGLAFSIFVHAKYLPLKSKE